MAHTSLPVHHEATAADRSTPLHEPEIASEPNRPAQLDTTHLRLLGEQAAMLNIADRYVSCKIHKLLRPGTRNADVSEDGGALLNSIGRAPPGWGRAVVAGNESKWTCIAFHFGDDHVADLLNIYVGR